MTLRKKGMLGQVNLIMWSGRQFVQIPVVFREQIPPIRAVQPDLSISSKEQFLLQIPLQIRMFYCITTPVNLRGQMQTQLKYTQKTARFTLILTGLYIV